MIQYEKIFTKEECEKIINFSQITNEDINFDFSNFPNASYEKNRIVFVKAASYNVYVVDNNENTEWMFDKLINWFSEKSGVKFNKEIKHDSCTLHNYIVGDNFSKHIDLSKGFEDRRYNLGIQLNEEYEGGEYICYDKNGDSIVLPKETGTAVFYHCRVPHEIKKITNGNRWSIVMPIYKTEIIEENKILI